MKIHLPPPVLEALRRLGEGGFAAYAVGGCVRDHFLGRPVREYDLCSAATPQQVHEVFAGERLIDTGIAHGTVTVVLGNMPLEITTFRADGPYSDSRHPDEVYFSTSIEEDLARRDFTCNAMAFNPTLGLVDPFDGQAACEKRELKAVGVAEQRFQEDALRILRGLRFAAVLGFTLEEKTAEAMRLHAPSLPAISRERIAQEMNKLLVGPSAAEVLKANPNIIALALGPSYRPPEDYNLRADSLRHLPPDLGTRWAAILPADNAQALMKDLRRSTQLNKGATLISRAAAQDMPTQTLPRLLARLGPQVVQAALQLQAARALSLEPPDEAAAREAREKQHAAKSLVDGGLPLTLKQLAIDGGDLAALGHSPGPAMGALLNKLWEEVLDGKLPNEREALLNAARQHRA